MPTIYAATRVRALRAKMFSHSELETLSEKEYTSIIYGLEKKGYPHLLDLIEENFAEDKLQKVLKKQDSEELRHIITSLRGYNKQFFEILLQKHDIDFIIALFRTKSSPKHKQYALKDLLFERKSFSQRDIDNILQSDTAQLIQFFKKTPYAKLITPYIGDLMQGKIAHVENELYDAFYKKLINIARNNTVLHSFVKQDIDIQNIRRALCFVQTDFIKGGTFSQKVLANIDASTDVKSIIAALSQTKYHTFIQHDQTVADMIKTLHRSKLASAKIYMKQEPLGIGQILAYYIQKRIELKNIRIILKLKNAYFENEEITQAII